MHEEDSWDKMIFNRFFAEGVAHFLSERVSIEGATCLLCALAIFTPVSAHAEGVADWENIASGTAFMSSPATVEYKIGYSNIGYDHFRSEIMLNWTDGEAQSQTIYEGIYDRPPAKVWGAGDRLCVSMQTCVRYEDNCMTNIIAYRYDADVKMFSEFPASGNLCLQAKK
ncbi:hypothetical protein HBA94_16395 [Ochrobactrum sp. GRS2]|nr:hypothetical protein [Ochrobactrum sp. GRS2]